MGLSGKCIVVGTDFGDAARVALDWAIAVARPLGVGVVLVHVFDLPLVGLPDAAILVGAEAASRISDEAQSALDAEVARVRGGGVSIEGRLRQGDARDVLHSEAHASDAVLLVLGSHGRRGVARLLLGSAAEFIARTSTVPVVIVRAPLPS